MVDVGPNGKTCDAAHPIDIGRLNLDVALMNASVRTDASAIAVRMAKESSLL